MAVSRTPTPTPTFTPIRRATAPNAWQPEEALPPASWELPAQGYEMLGRYGLCEQISSGGMAAVHLGFLLGSKGFSRFVALKRMRPELARDPSLVARFEHEVLLGARIRHPNVVQTLDVVPWKGELLLVMEYIHGENLAGLLQAASRAGAPLALEVTLNIVASALHGLHAAHEVVDIDGAPLALVHRDFSPQNVLVGSDGHARILDFGVAKSLSQLIVTRVGEIAGKVSYMAPEQLRGAPLDRRADVFSAGIVCWEALTGGRLFGSAASDSPETMLAVLEHPITAPSRYRSSIPPAIDAVVLRALRRNPEERYRDAREFALALEATGLVGGPTAVAGSVQTLCADHLQQLSEAEQRAARAVPLAQRTFADVLPVSTRDAPTLVKARSNARCASSSPWRRRTRFGVGALALLGIGMWQLRVSGSGRRAAPAPLAAKDTAAKDTAAKDTAAKDTAAKDTAAKDTAAKDAVAAADHGPRSELPTPSESAAFTLHNPAAAPADRGASPPVSLGARTRTEPKRLTPRASADKPVCAQPTYLDSNGIRHFKDECL